MNGSNSSLARSLATDGGGRARFVARLGVVLLVMLACAVRLIHLDADPVFPTWISYIVDEGRWNESARNMVLFGTTDAFAERIHLMLSPAYQLCSYLAFKWHGISFVSARASSALAGSALVIVVALCLRRHVTLFALTVGIVILGFETNMLVQSRLALPEIPAAFATLISAMVLLLARQTRRNAALAGFLFTVALAFKGTVVMVAPAFFVIALLPSDPLSWRARVERTLAFAAGAGIVLAAGLAAGLATHLLAVENIWRLGPRLLGFVSAVHPSAAMWNFFA